MFRFMLNDELWSRQWKMNLIEEFNPEWRDLYEEICQ